MPIKESAPAQPGLKPGTEQFEKLKRQCGSMLRANGLRPDTKTGAKAVHTFWYGALCALNDETNPLVCICLLSGRHNELVDNQGE